MKRAVFSLTVNRRIITAVFAAFLAAVAASFLVLSDPGEVRAQEQQEVKQLSAEPTLVYNNAVNECGDERDPHVSDGLISYTHICTDSEIRYYDLATKADKALPQDEPANDVLSDVSGTKVSFTRQTAEGTFIYLFDTVGTDPPRELAPRATPASESRTGSAIGGNTVAWVDYSVSPFGEIEVHDLLASGDAAKRLTEDEYIDWDVAVSTSGDVVVWDKCDRSGANCDIYKSERTNGTFGEPGAVTAAGREDVTPDTDGSLIAYASLSGEQDIFYQPVSGGTEQQISLPGEQANPSVSGGLIMFESRSQPGANADLFVYDTKTGTLYQLTNMPETDESLPDIWVGPDGDVQATWQQLDHDLNVYAASFELPAEQTYNFSGFFSPVDNPPVVNTVNGRAGKVGIPVKFSLDGDQGLDIFEENYPLSTVLSSCPGQATADAIEQTVALTAPGKVPEGTLKYDAATDQYIYTWNTPEVPPGTCVELNLKLKDGTDHKALFEFSKKR